MRRLLRTRIALKVGRADWSSSANRAILPIFKSCQTHKTKVCLRDRRGEYTFGGMARSGKTLSEQISSQLGGRKQERVVLFCPGGGFAVLAQWAAWMSGQIVVPVDDGCPQSLLGHVLKDSGSTLALTTAEHSEQLREAAKGTDLQVLLVPTDLLDEARSSQQEKAEAEEQDFGQSEEFYGSADALLLYTAGTTGTPKGAVLSFSNLDSQAKAVVGPWCLTSSDCVLNLRPLSSTDGISCGLLAPFSVGASVVLVENFSIEDIWAEILGVQGAKTDRINVMVGSSGIYRDLIEEYENVKERRKWNEKMEEYVKGICVQKIRLMLSTSFPLPKSVLEKWESYTGHDVYEVYGLTEAGVVASPRPSTTKHTSTVGLPVPGIKMKIISDVGDVIAEGDSSGTKVLSIWEDRPVAGALWLKGQGISRKYWNEGENNSSWSSDGWFKTGDIASYSKGQYNILGRQNCDIVKTKAYKISLLQIEAAILDIPEVQDVAAFNVIQNGVSTIAAAVCRKTGKIVNFENIKISLQQRFPEYAVPTVIFDIPIIPRNYRGMIVRNEIQSYFLQHFQHTQSLRKERRDKPSK